MDGDDQPPMVRKERVSDSSQGSAEELHNTVSRNFRWRDVVILLAQITDRARIGVLCRCKGTVYAPRESSPGKPRIRS
jgi:hypothetical protein